MEEKLKKVILDYKSLPNRDLEFGLEKLSEDFESTKELLIKLSLHLDSLEENYNKILKEFNRRKNNGQ